MDQEAEELGRLAYLAYRSMNPDIFPATTWLVLPDDVKEAFIQLGQAMAAWTDNVRGGV